MSKADNSSRNLREALNHASHAYHFIVQAAGQVAPPDFPPHVARQLLTLAQQALDLEDKLKVMLESIPMFETPAQPPRTDL